MKLNEIIEKLWEWLEKQGYSKGTMKKYKTTLKRIASAHLIKSDIYNPEIASELVMSMRKKYESQECTYATFRTTRKLTALLDEYYTTASLSWDILPLWKMMELNEYFQMSLCDFRLFWEERGVWGKDELTKQTHYVEKFFEYLQENDCNSLSNITMHTLIDYLNYSTKHHKNGLKNIVSALRNLCKYMKDRHISDIDMQDLSSFKVPGRKTIMPAFTHDEVSRILRVSKGESPKDKRDYAMFAIAASTGMRAGDIVNIKLKDINWIKREINIVQSKTNKPNGLPLETYVGNAIADYILTARPETDVEYIFISFTKPHRKVISSVVKNNLKARISEANISHQPGQGTHSFRRYTATNLLNNGVSFEKIGDVLGHKNPKSLWSYIRTNAEGLKTCALNFEGIEVAQEDLL